MSRHARQEVRRARAWSAGRVVALGAWLWGASVAAFELTPRQQGPSCQEDCLSAQEKCSAVCRTHAERGVNICLSACVQVERECRQECRAPREVSDDR